MPERPSIVARGIIRAERIADRLYEVEMPNGHRAHAVVKKDGPRCPLAGTVGHSVTVSFSPFDMSRCQIVEWHAVAAEWVVQPMEP